MDTGRCKVQSASGIAAPITGLSGSMCHADCMIHMHTTGVCAAGRDTSSFSSEDASGSTSQAANIQEALEVGCTALLLDEDTCATNFMVWDERMQVRMASFGVLQVTVSIRRQPAYLVLAIHASGHASMKKAPAL